LNREASDNSTEIKDVTKVLDQNFVAVDNVSLSITRGDFFLCWGPPDAEKQLY
jgi:ABC-type multidrug transport system ATPase subunit